MPEKREATQGEAMRHESRRSEGENTPAAADPVVGEVKVCKVCPFQKKKRERTVLLHRDSGKKSGYLYTRWWFYLVYTFSTLFAKRVLTIVVSVHNMVIQVTFLAGWGWGCGRGEGETVVFLFSVYILVVCEMGISIVVCIWLFRLLFALG